MTFDSKREAERYLLLRDFERMGKITDLRLQVPYELIPPQRVGKQVIRGVRYIADFVYRDADGNEVVEDAKGMKTDVYVLKKKLMLYRYGILVREV